MSKLDVAQQSDALLDDIAGYQPRKEQKIVLLEGTTQRVENVDCRRGMAGLEDNSISMVLTDPPYFIDGMDGNWDKDRMEERIKKGDVVRGLPVGMKFSKGQSSALFEFMHPIAVEWMRVVKPGGFVLCFMQPRLSHSVAWAMEKAGIEIRDMFTWVRDGQAKAFSQTHFINKRKISDKAKRSMLKKVGDRKTPQLRPMGETIILGQVPREGTFVDNFIEHDVGLIDISNPLLDPNSFPSTIMTATKPSKGDRHGHITPKPVDLLRHLIRIFSGVDPLILDSFAGCGSCGEAAVLEGKNFLGFEIDPTYAKTANVRISEARLGVNKKTNQSGIR